MKEIKTDLFPKNLYASRNVAKPEAQEERANQEKTAEPLPESTRPRKDGPGGE